MFTALQTQLSREGSTKAHAFPLAICRTLHARGCNCPILYLLKPHGSFAVFFSKVRAPCKAVERKHQDCKATYVISCLLITRGVLVPPRVNGKWILVRCKRSLRWLFLVVAFCEKAVQVTAKVMTVSFSEHLFKNHSWTVKSFELCSLPCLIFFQFPGLQQGRKESLFSSCCLPVCFLAVVGLFCFSPSLHP